MPPELIITPAQKSSDGAEVALTEAHELHTPKGGKTNHFLSELPPICRNKRTNTWHNFKKCVPMLK